MQLQLQRTIAPILSCQTSPWNDGISEQERPLNKATFFAGHTAPLKPIKQPECLLVCIAIAAVTPSSVLSDRFSETMAFASAYHVLRFLNLLIQPRYLGTGLVSTLTLGDSKSAYCSCYYSAYSYNSTETYTLTVKLDTQRIVKESSHLHRSWASRERKQPMVIVQSVLLSSSKPFISVQNAIGRVLIVRIFGTGKM